MDQVLQFAAFLGVLRLWIAIFGSAGIVGFVVSIGVGFVVGKIVYEWLFGPSSND